MSKVNNLILENEALREKVESLQDIIDDLEHKTKRQRRIINGLKINNSALTLERKKLLEELTRYKNMGLWEFANTLSDEEQEKAGHEFAQQLLGGK